MLHLRLRPNHLCFGRIQSQLFTQRCWISKKVFVSGIAMENTARRLFSDMDVVSVTPVPTHNGTSLNNCIVEFRTEAEAQSARVNSAKSVEGRSVMVHRYIEPPKKSRRTKQ
eukprot:Filipodium_phascolosomae@DN2538_c0_g1_i1.p1